MRAGEEAEKCCTGKRADNLEHLVFFFSPQFFSTIWGWGGSCCE
jgi:hypothetical protein